MTNISHYDSLCARASFINESHIIKSGEAVLLKRRREWMEFRRGRTFNNPSSHVCRWLTRTKMPITATVESPREMWSADFAEISRWFDTSDSASVRKLLRHFFSPGARFVASSRIETLSSFRLGNRFFIALIPLSRFSSSPDKLFLCRKRCAIKNRSANKKNFQFLPSSICNLLEVFAGRWQSGRLKENFPSRKNNAGVWTFPPKIPAFNKTFPASDFKS